jgi:hypothetical protein
MAGKIACRSRTLNASLKKELQNKIIIFIKEFLEAQSKNCANPETVSSNL